VADFEAIAAGIFKEPRIIPRTFIIAWPFDMLSARLDCDLGEPIHVAARPLMYFIQEIDEEFFMIS